MIFGVFISKSHYKWLQSEKITFFHISSRKWPKKVVQISGFDRGYPIDFVRFWRFWKCWYFYSIFQAKNIKVSAFFGIKTSSTEQGIWKSSSKSSSFFHFCRIRQGEWATETIFGQSKMNKTWTFLMTFFKSLAQ